MTIDDVKAVLRELGLQSEWVTEQTAFCILALSDSRPRQGLLAGHASLSDGARIHDILNFVRRELGRQVAENTREAYRKTSLNPLVEVGWAVRHQLSTNDPNTYYRLHPSFANLLALAPGPERDALIAGLRLRRQEAAHQMSDLQNDVPVRVTAGRIHTLSPGEHSLLARAVVETLGPALLSHPRVVYLGDTAPRAGFQDRALMRRLNLPIAVHVSLPDVILHDEGASNLLIVEVVVSSGIITDTRLQQLRDLAKGALALDHQVTYVTAFPSRRALRRFVEQIAWGTSVWIADEPYNIIHFSPVKEGAGPQR